MDIYNTEGFITSFDQEKLWFKTYSRVTPQETQGPNIILVHGLSNDGQVWEGVIEHLLTKHPQTQIVTYDLRGHGASSQRFNHLTRAYKLEEVHARDLSQVISSLGGHKPVLAGHSFGGIVIQEYVLQTAFWPWSSRRPRGIVLVGTDIHTFTVNVLDRPKIMRTLMKLEASKKSQPHKRSYEFYQQQLVSRTKDHSLLNIFYSYSNMNRENFFRHWLGIANWYNSDPDRMLKKLGSGKKTDLSHPKCILVYGLHDLFFPPQEVSQTLIDHPQIKGVPVDTTHAIPVQAPDAVAREISTFL